MGYIGVGRKYPTNLHNQWLMEIKPISMAMMAAWVRSEAPYAGAASLDKEEPRTPTTRSSRVLHPKMPSFVTQAKRREIRYPKSYAYLHGECFARSAEV
jgi:hypothetical protein